MNNPTLKPAHLRRIKSLGLLTDEQLTALACHAEVVNCAQSDVLFREGDPGDALYMILEGQMRVFTKQKSGAVLFLRLLDTGELFGEVALLTQTPRSASVEAVRSSTLIKLTSAGLQNLIAAQPAAATQVLYFLARVLGRQLNDLTVKLRAQRNQTEFFSFLQ